MKHHLRHQLRLAATGAAVGAVAAVASLGAATPSGAASKSPNLSSVTLNIGLNPGGTYQALEASGAYKSAPYTINWDQLQGASPMLEALNAGSISVAYGTGGTSFTVAQGNATTPWTAATAPFKTIAFYNPKNEATDPEGVILAGKGTGITSLADLKGKKIGYTQGGFLQVLALTALNKAHLSLSDVQSVNLPYTTDLQALESGAVDAVVTSYSDREPAVSAGATVVATSYSLGVQPNSVVGIQASVLKSAKLSAAVGDWLKRTKKALAWEAAHPAPVEAILAQADQVSATVAAVIYKGSLAQLQTVTAARIAQEQAKEKLLHAAGITTNPVNVSIQFSTKYNPIVG